MLDKYVLIQFKNNWADEIDVVGFTIMTKEKWDEYVFCLQHCIAYPKQASVGSNQYLEFEHYPSYIQSCKVKEITYDEVIFITRMFEIELDGWMYYGQFAEIVDGNMEDEFYSEYVEGDEDSGGFVGVEKAKEILKTIPDEKKREWRNQN